MVHHPPRGAHVAAPSFIFMSLFTVRYYVLRAMISAKLMMNVCNIDIPLVIDKIYATDQSRRKYSIVLLFLSKLIGQWSTANLYRKSTKDLATDDAKKVIEKEVKIQNL